jgi:hypothetical protein
MGCRSLEDRTVLEFLLRVPIWFLEKQYAWLSSSPVSKCEISWAVTLESGPGVQSGLHEQTVIATREQVEEVIRFQRRLKALMGPTVEDAAEEEEPKQIESSFEDGQFIEAEFGDD